MPLVQPAFTGEEKLIYPNPSNLNYHIALKTYCVPNLQLDLFSLNVYHPRTKLNPDSQVMHLGKTGCAKPQRAS